MPELFTSSLNSTLIPTKLASEISGYNSDYLGRLCREGKISGMQVGRSWLIDSDTLENFVKTQEEKKIERAEKLRIQRGKEYRRAQKPVFRSALASVTTVKTNIVKHLPRVPSPFISVNSPTTYSRPLVATAVALAVVAGSAFASTNAGIIASFAKLPESAIRLALNESSALDNSAQLRVTDFSDIANIAEVNDSKLTASAIVPTLSIPHTRATTNTFSSLGGTATSHSIASVHKLSDEARAPFTETKTAQVAQQRISLLSLIVSDPKGSLIKTYVMSGLYVFDIGALIGDVYLASIHETGDIALTSAANTRDAVTYLPRISSAILKGYESGMYAFNDAAPKAAGTAVLALYDTGTFTNVIAKNAPSTARKTKDVIANTMVSTSLALTESVNERQVLAVAPISTSVAEVGLPSLAKLPSTLQNHALGLIGNSAVFTSHIYGNAVDVGAKIAALPIQAEDTLLGIAGYTASILDGTNETYTNTLAIGESDSSVQNSASSLPASVLTFVPASIQRAIGDFFHTTSTFAQALFRSGVRTIASLFPGGNVIVPTLTIIDTKSAETLAPAVPAGALTRVIDVTSGGANSSNIRNIINNYYPQTYFNGSMDEAILAIVRPFVRDSVQASLRVRGGGGDVSSEGATLTNVTITGGSATLASLTSTEGIFETLTALIANIGTTTSTNLISSTTVTNTLTVGTTTTGLLTAGTTTLGTVTAATTSINGDLTVNGNITGTSLSVGSLSSNGVVTASFFIATDTAATSTFTNIAVTNSNTTNATSTNLFASAAHFVNGIFDSFTATLATITNLNGTNFDFTYGTTTNATSTNLYAVNGTIDSLSTTNLGLGGQTFTSLLGTGLVNNGGVLSVSTSSLALDTTYFKQGGNAYGTAAVFGTTDANGINIITNNAVAATFTAGGNLGLGTTSPSERLSVSGNALVSGGLSATSLSAGTLITTGNANVNSLTIGSLTGFLKATAGAISTSLIDLSTDVTSTLPVGNGGTGATTLTGLVIGNGAGAFTATTLSLGVASQISDETGTGSLVFSASPTFTGTSAFANVTAGNATSTSIHTSTLGLGGSYFTSFLGNGLTNVGGALTVSTSSLATGFFQQNGNSFGGLATLGTNDNNNLAFETNNITRLTIDTSGNVGIGTTSPQTNLHIGGGGQTMTQIGYPGIYINPSGGQAQLTVENTAGNEGGFFTHGNGNMYFGTWSNNPLIFRTNNTDRGVITTAGNFGIGTTTPVAKLSVSGTTEIATFGDGTVGQNAYIGLSNVGTAGNNRSSFGYNGTTANTVVQGGAGKGIEFNVNNSFGSGQAMVITSTGNVGIGTTTPDKLMVINGNNATLAIDAISGGNDTSSILFRSINAGDPAGSITNSWTSTGMTFTSPRDLTGQSGFHFKSNAGTERLTIDTGNGNVGIGTAAPGATLDIVNALSTQYAATAILVHAIGDTNFMLTARKGQTTNVNGDIMSKLTLNYGVSTQNASINFHRGAGTTGGFLSFSTNTDLERMRIDQNGNVGIGTTTPSQALSVQGNGLFSGNLTTANLTATGTIAFTGLGSGLVKSTSGTLSVATSGTDYAPATTGTSLLYGNGAGGFSNASVSSPLTFSAGALGIQVANTSQNGYLSSTDWNTFNGKQAALTFTYPLVNSANTVSLAFGTTTSNTWGGTQTFTNAPVLTGLSGLLQGNGSSAVTAVTGTAGQFPYYNGTNTLAATSTLFLSTAGNVGVGTTTPGANLVVNGTTGQNLLQIATSTNQNILVVNQNGNLGIKVANPAFNIDISGNAKINGSNQINLSISGGNVFAGLTTQTGINSYSSTAPIIFSLNQGVTEIARFAGTTGYFGIGTTSPMAALSLGNGQIAVPNGSASAPSYSFSTSPNDGFTLAAAGQLSLITGGIERFRINGSGLSYQGSASGPMIATAVTSGTVPSFIPNRSDTTTGIGASSAGTLSLITGGGNRLEITNTGNVGIGTTAPNNKLQVAGLISFNDTTRSTMLGSGAGFTMAQTGNLYNTGVGYNSLYNTTTGTNNTAVGNRSLLANTTGQFNTANGSYALYNNTTGNYNTASGYTSLYNNTTGGSNTATGDHSLYSNTTGANNTANGYESQYSNTTGYQNISMGFRSLYNNSIGANNTALGFYSMYGGAGTASGDYNVAVGQYTLNSYTTGASNTAIGAQAMYLTTSGTQNTSVGLQAGYDITTGNYNTIIGNFSTTGVGITTGSNNIIIGQGVRSGLSQTGSNQLNIGNLIFGTGIGSGSTLSTGNVGIGTAAPGYKLDVYGASHVAGSTAAGSLVIDRSGSIVNRFRMFVGDGTSGYLSDENYISSLNTGLHFLAGGTGTTEIMTLLSSGNVGIGTASPSSKLHVEGGAIRVGAGGSFTTAVNTQGIVLDTSASTAGIEFNTVSSGSGYGHRIISVDSGAGSALLNIQGRSNSGTFSDIATFMSTGNVGIGTTTPTAKLLVYQSNTTIDGIRVDNPNSSTVYSGQLGGLSIANTDPTANNFVRLNFQGYSGNAASASIGARLLDHTNSYADLVFWTRSAAGHSEKMTILSDGKVGIGTTTPSNKLDVAGSLGIIDSNPLVFIGPSNGAMSSTNYHTLGYAAGNGYHISNSTLGDFTIGARAGSNILFGTNTSGIPNSRMIITSAGNVGIGTVAPQTTLHVYKTSAAAETTPLILQNANDTTGTAVAIGFSGHSASGLVTAKISNIVAGPNNYQLAFSTYGSSLTEWLRIDQNGNVGIGTASPNAKTEIYTNTASNTELLRLTNDDASGNGSKIQFVSVGGVGGIIKSYYSSNWKMDLGTNANLSTMTLSSGNVGIGTASPAAKLHIYQTAGGSNTFTLDTSFAGGNAFALNPFVTGVSNGGFSIRDVTNSADRLVIQNSTGNVGIGTTSPATLLSNTSNVIQDSLGSGQNAKGIAWTVAGSRYAAGFQNTDTGSGGHGLVVSIGGTADTNRILALDSGGASRLIVLGNGNVGIGTVSPTAGRLVTNLTGAYNTVNESIVADVTVSGGSGANPAYYGSFKMSGNGYDWGAIRTIQTNPSASWLSRMAFFTMNGNGGSLIERMSIDNSGNVGIGTTAPARKLSVYEGSASLSTIQVANSTTGQTLSDGVQLGVDGSGAATLWNYENTQLDFGTNNSTRVSIAANGAVSVINLVSCGGIQTNGSGTMSCTSDARLKNIQSEFTSGLDAINQITPQTYSWKNDSGLYDGGVLYSGFIAQDVGAAIPEAMNEGANGYKQINTTTILAASVNAIKELAGRTTTLSIATTSLSTQINTLSAAFSASQASSSMPQALTATNITAQSMAIALGVSAGSMTAQSANIDGTVSAARYVVPSVAEVFTFGSSTMSATLPSEVLTQGNSADLFKMASYAIASAQFLGRRTDLLATRLDVVESRLAAIEASAGNSIFSVTALKDALESLGILFKDGKVLATNLMANVLSVGSAEHPTGVTFFDKTSGAPYCLSIIDGNQNITAGECIPGDLTNPAPQPSSPLPSQGSGTGNSGDVAAPTVTLNGSAAMEIMEYSTWNDPGATAIDAVDGDLTSSIQVVGGVNTSAPGLYTVQYRVMDSAGNQGSASRVVMVKPPTSSTPAPTPSTPPASTPAPQSSPVAEAPSTPPAPTPSPGA